MKEYSPAVKAFIVNNDKLFIIKRSDKDIQKPGIWEIPGGRLENDEDSAKGLKREVKEETNLDIEVIKPLNVQRFARDDNQNIELTTYLCKTLTKNVKLSEEHTAFEWIDIEKAKAKLADFFHKEVDIFKKQD